VLALLAFAALPVSAQQCAFTVESEWNNPDPPLPLWGDQAFCYLTGVSGSFRGGGEMARVRQKTDGTWVLEGSSGQGFLKANSVCAMKSCFNSASGGTARWSSAQFSATSTSDGPNWPWEQCWQGLFESTALWRGDAHSVLNGIEGRFDGAGEFAGIEASGGPLIASQLFAKDSACTDSYTRGYANSFFVGTPGSGTMARYAGPKGYGTAQAAGEYQVSAIGGSGATVMIPTYQGVCFFTEISGRFRGGGEGVKITRQTIDGVQRWVLTAKHAGAEGGVWARARCMPLGQP
jgi:hypothetical protein